MRNMRKILLLIGVGLCVLFIATIGITSLSAHQQQAAVQKVSDAFINDIIIGSAPASYSFYTSTTKDGLDLSDWQTQVQAMSSTFKGNRPTLLSNTISGNTALVQYKISGIDGDYKLSVNAVKSGSGWLVQSFDSQYGA